MAYIYLFKFISIDSIALGKKYMFETKFTSEM